MGSIVILGGGVCGLAAGMMLTRDGHQVTVLERDAGELPAAVDGWDRAGVGQFGLPHFFHPRSRQILDAELPGITEAFAAAGALAIDPIETMPPMIEDRSRRPGDERFATLTGRRALLELVIARAAEAEPGLDVRRGTAAAALLASGSNGRAHVRGVRTADGTELSADLVVDAMGRSSRLPAMLAEQGIDSGAEESEDSGFVYYGRWFRGELPDAIGPPLVAAGSISILTLPGDNGTWSITLVAGSGDQPLKTLRHTEIWESVVRACPLHVQWLEGEPLGEITAMGGIIDRYRAPAPAATGIVRVADACACTNPSLGRGISLGLLHVAALRGVVREQLGDPAALAAAWSAATAAEYEPWYRVTLDVDKARLADIEAARAGVEAPRSGGHPDLQRALFEGAMALDPDVFRAGMEIAGCLTHPDEVLARPGFSERVLELAAQFPKVPWGPEREQLLELVGAPTR